jgi:inward rectifier potassium channel
MMDKPELDKQNFDPGLTQRYEGKLRRAIRKDGEFNVQRHGITWRDVHPYLYLINRPWPVFLAMLFGAFIAVNVLFAVIYDAIGIENLHGADAPTAIGRFLNAFYFSSQTLTTVGYGTIYPASTAANLIASFEAMIGLMGFAVVTGFLIARVSRPMARLGFSQSMIVAPYRDGTSLQFRIVNRSMSNLMEVEARVLLMTVEMVDGRLERRYAQLELERDNVLFLALTWTIVHPITSQSPLYGKTAADLERLQAEALILIKGTDDTFSQTVHARHSYRYDEIIWGVKFAPAFDVDSNGDIQLEVDRVSDLNPISGEQS